LRKKNASPTKHIGAKPIGGFNPFGGQNLSGQNLSADKTYRRTKPINLSADKTNRDKTYVSADKIYPEKTYRRSKIYRRTEIVAVK
jgi:hypothetical protein